MIVQKLDFSTWVDFTQNIEANKIDPYILSIDTIEILPVLGDTLHAAILLISDTNPIAWDVATTYAADDYVSYENVLYKALQATTGDVPTDLAPDWEVSPLGTFWLNYVKPWAVYEIASDFYLWHGINTTQFGLRENYEETSTSVSGDVRAALIHSIKNKAKVFKAKMLNYLCDEDWTIDGTVYTIDCTDYKSSNIFQIRAVGTRKNYTDQ